MHIPILPYRKCFGFKCPTIYKQALQAAKKGILKHKKSSIFGIIALEITITYILAKITQSPTAIMNSLTIISRTEATYVTDSISYIRYRIERYKNGIAVISTIIAKIINSLGKSSGCSL